MNILLIITTSNGRKQLFLNEEFGATQLSDLIATLSLEHSTLEVVSRAGSPYIRSKKDGTKSNNLTSISVSYGQIQKALCNLARPTTNQTERLVYAYLKKRSESIIQNSSGQEIIFIDGFARATRPEVESHIKHLKKYVIHSSQTQQIDPFLLSAILIDEYCRKELDDTLDFLAWFGLNTSVGVAQIKLKTAREMIAVGYIPNISSKISDPDLYRLLTDNQMGVAFCAARIRQILDYWKSNGHPLSAETQVGVVGQLYSQGLGSPKSNPVILARGAQAIKFYALAKTLSDA
jgi:hypothetical protein